MIYIGGYSRSGSTLLDVVLGSHGQAFGSGELSFLLDDWNNALRECACGQRYSHCPFWGDLLPSGIDTATTAAVRLVESRRNLPRLTRGVLPRHVVDTYRSFQMRLFDFMREHAGQDLIVDSSKSARGTAGRPLALRDLAQQDVFFLHLVRDGLATLASYEAVGSNWSVEGHGSTNRLAVLRAGVGWTITNSIASRIAGRFGDKSLVLHYEDLVSDPAASLRRVGEHAGVDLSDIIGRVQAGHAFAAGHQVGGNRLRFQREIHFRAPSVDDRRVASWHRIPFKIYARRQQHRLGYTSSPESIPASNGGGRERK